MKTRRLTIKRWLWPLCCAVMLLGAAFCMGCDLAARTAFAPTELAVSTVTAFFGAPVVIALMLRRSAGREEA